MARDSDCALVDDDFRFTRMHREACAFMEVNRVLVVHDMRSMFVFLCKMKLNSTTTALLDGRTLNVATCDLSADNLDRPAHSQKISKLPSREG